MFGERILRLRKKRGWSQRELGKHVGTSDQVISRYERGEMTPSVEAAARIAEALGVSLDYLAGLSEADQMDRRMLKRLDAIGSLAEEDQATVFRVVDALVRDAEVRRTYAPEDD